MLPSSHSHNNNCPHYCLRNPFLLDQSYDDIWEDSSRPEERQFSGQIPPSMSLSGSSLPMEFVQVLIHQHARTLVALKTLRSEVNTLRKVPPPPHLKSTPPKVPSNSQDSGFSNATTNSSSDELYSLLSLIHDKVSVGVKNSSSNGGRSRSRALGLQGEEAKLGYLDGLLGNEEFDFGRFTKIDRRVVKEILNCNSVDELRRQLLFTHAKVESLTAGKKQKEVTVTPPPSNIPHPLPLALATKIPIISSVANTTTTVSVETDSNSNSNNHSSSCNLRSHGSGGGSGGGGGGNNHHSSNQMRSLIPVPVRRLKNSANNSNNNNNLDCNNTTGKVDKPPPPPSSSAIVNNKVKRLSNWKSYWFS